MHAGVTKFGAIALLAGGVLWLGKSVLELVAGAPPSTGSDILAWRDAQELPLALTNEVEFFAVAAFVPGFVALYRKLAKTHPTTAVLGCGLLALTLPILTVALVVHGRLVFPIFGIRAHTPEIAEMLVVLYFGALHAAALVFAIATFAMGLALRKTAPTVAYLGFVTSMADVAASYPDHIGPLAALLCGALFAAWWIAVGVWLLSSDGMHG